LGQPNLVFNTGFTYAAPQFLKRFDVSTVAEVIPIPIPIPSSPLDALSRVSIGRRISSDGSDTIVTVEPSWGLWLAQQAELLLAHSPVLQVLSQHQQHRSVVQ